MFGMQSKAQKDAAAAEAAAAEAAALEAASRSNRLWGKPQVEIVRTWARPRVDQRVGAARDWAKPRVGRGIGVAAPRLDTAVQSLGPVVDKSRDKIVDELLPRLSELVAALAASSLAVKDEVTDRTNGAAAVLSGEAEAQPKGGARAKLLLILSVLAGALAAAAAVFSQRRKSDDDPWATPLSDPYAAPATPAADIVDDSATPVFDATTSDAAATNDPAGDLGNLEGLMSVDEEDVTVVDAVPGDDAGIPPADGSGAHHEEGEHRH